jgi:mono/diheme cytochrome c family protein
VSPLPWPFLLIRREARLTPHWGSLYAVDVRCFCLFVRNVLLLSAVCLGLVGRDGLMAAEASAGLAQTLRSGTSSDHRSADGIALFVPSGESATPFLVAGPFTSVWSGELSVDLRGEYSFHGLFTGHLKVSINDAVVLDADGKSPAWIDSAKVRLNKGANKIIAEYSAPKSGESLVRLYWSGKEVPFNPIPVAALSHSASAEIASANQLRRGRHLFAELRCAQCHTTPGGMPDLAADAPAFGGIGSRRHSTWLAQWIANPESQRPGSPMPALFHGADAATHSDAIAAFLSSLKAANPPSPAPTSTTELVEAGKSLYEKLHCVACHVAPDDGKADPAKISQKQVLAKFKPGALIGFLRKPSEHFAWIGMPDFKLSTDEASQLAAYLESAAEKPSERSIPSDEALILKGKNLVQSSGCLNCHTLDIPNTYKAPALVSLKPEAWSAGCLAASPAPESKAPRYALSAADRQALAAFGRTDRSSLTRHTAADFLERQSVSLNCRECHGKFEGFPAWELLGGKLKPEWARRFIGGSESWKPRPWLESRMPAFPTHAALLGQGLATAHGLAPVTTADDAPDAELAKVGLKLVGSSGGFACISCHSVGDFGATQVFEAPGINLAHSFERLQPDFYRRWLRNPVSLDPNSKMPAYFDEDGKSALADVLEGDGPKTIRALWEYIRLGAKMPKPE